MLRICVVLFLVFAAGCSSLKSLVTEPKVSFHSVSVKDAKKDGATAVIALDVYNPNAIAVTVDRLQYTLELAGRSIATSEVSKPSTIEARATSRVEIPVPFRYDQVFASVLDLLGKGTAAYKVKGSAKVGVFSIPFDHTGDLKIRE